MPQSDPKNRLKEIPIGKNEIEQNRRFREETEKKLKQINKSFTHKTRKRENSITKRRIQTDRDKIKECFVENTKVRKSVCVQTSEQNFNKLQTDNNNTNSDEKKRPAKAMVIFSRRPKN